MRIAQPVRDFRSLHHRGGSTVLIVIVLVLLAALVGGSVYLWNTLIGTQTNTTPDHTQGTGISTPEHAEEILESARAYLREDQPEKARVLLELAIIDYPADQDLRVAYAESLLGVHKEEQAYEQYVESQRIGPKQAWIEAAAGTLANKLGQPDAAMLHYKAAQQLDPNDPKHPLYLGQLQRTAGQRTEAEASMMMVLRLDAENAIAAGTLADMLLEDNMVEQALRQIAIARKVEPDNEVWKLIEARGLNRINKPEQALLLLQTFNVNFLLKEHVRRLYGEVCGKLNRPKDAANLYARAVEVDRQNTTLLMETAAWFERAEDFAQALDFARSAEQLGAENAARMVDRLNQKLADAGGGE
ncbi:MAG: hypothetical protein H6815_01965 [Phycisphaeraceae bacterium]|nr:hypothetical protein [Phycisphaerales bacterium]MCB9859195.1 hypothetical protein [Phycisphaeraceae bacterium]